MDTEDVEVKFRKSKKRKSEKAKIDGVDMNSDHNIEKVSKESCVLHKKQKEKKKKFTAQEADDSSSKKCKKADKNGTTCEDMKEESNENAKSSKKSPSKRQLKREKAEQREAEQRNINKTLTTQRALNYVLQWKYSRSEWKFEKLKQIWLMDNLLNKDSIPDVVFPTVLEYFEGCKGMAREVLLKKGMEVIRKVEEENDTNNENNEITESVMYKRARQLLQTLPTET